MLYDNSLVVLKGNSARMFLLSKAEYATTLIVSLNASVIATDAYVKCFKS